MKIDDVYRKINPTKFFNIEPTDVVEDANFISYFVIKAHIQSIIVVRIPDYEESQITEFDKIKNVYRTDTRMEPFYLQKTKFDISDFLKYKIFDVVIDKSKKAWLVNEVKNDAIFVQKFPPLKEDNFLYKIEAKDLKKIDSVWEVRP